MQFLTKIWSENGLTDATCSRTAVMSAPDEFRLEELMRHANRKRDLRRRRRSSWSAARARVI